MKIHTHFVNRLYCANQKASNQPPSPWQQGEGKKEENMIRFEYQTYCNEYKIIKVSRKAYIIKYIDYYQHICWMVKEHKFKSRLKAEKHIKKHFIVEDKK